MKKYLFLFLFVFSGAAEASESSITTHYPSPEGDFKELRIKGDAVFSAEAGQKMLIGTSEADAEDAKLVIKADGSASAQSGSPIVFKMEDRNGRDVFRLNERGEATMPDSTYSDIYIGKTGKWISQMTAAGGNGIPQTKVYMYASGGSSGIGAGTVRSECHSGDIMIGGGCQVSDNCTGSDTSAFFSYPPDLHSWVCGTAECGSNFNSAWVFCFDADNSGGF